MAAHRLLVGLPVRLAQQLGGYQQIEQLQGVIDRPGLQLTTVASSVASRRCGGCRFNRAGLPAMP
jgi:hypothetical protein